MVVLISSKGTSKEERSLKMQFYSSILLLFLAGVVHPAIPFLGMFLGATLEFSGIFVFIADFLKSVATKSEMPLRNHGFMKNGLFLPCIWSWFLVYLGIVTKEAEEQMENHFIFGMLLLHFIGSLFEVQERFLASHRIVLKLRRRNIATFRNVFMAVFDNHNKFDYLGKDESLGENKEEKREEMGQKLNSMV